MDQNTEQNTTTNPVAPVPTPVVQPPQTALPPQLPPQKSNKKNLIIIGVASAVGLLIVVIAVVILMVALLSVSKADYQAALRQYDNVSSANSSLVSGASSLTYSVDSSTDTTFDNDMSGIEKDIAKIKSENERLGKLKAVSVGDGKKFYDAFDKKLAAYVTYTSNLATSLKNSRSALKGCKAAQDATTASAIAVVLKNCSDSLKAVKDLPDADYKTFIGTVQSAYEEYAGIATELAGISDPYGAQYDQYKALRDKTYAVQDKISDAKKDFESNSEKHSDETSPKEAANALRDFLVEKSIK